MTPRQPVKAILWNGRTLNPSSRTNPALTARALYCLIIRQLPSGGKPDNTRDGAGAGAIPTSSQDSPGTGRDRLGLPPKGPG